MIPTEINQRVAAYMRQHSAHEIHREHFGMSSIGMCQRALFHFWQSGSLRVPTEREYQNFIRGRYFESLALKILVAEGIARRVPERESFDLHGYYHCGSERELVAPWDARLKGHTDGETTDGLLLELKSVTQDKLDRVRATGKAAPHEFRQVQLYLLYGGYERAVLHYIVPESFDHDCLAIPHYPSVSRSLEEKAKRVIRALDSKDRSLVPCECGKCGR